MKKAKKRKLNFKRTLFFLLLIYIICYGTYRLLNQRIKHIEIIGNDLVSDNEIIKLAKIDDYPSIFKYTNRKIEKNIKKHKLINEVDIKKRLNFIIKIDIKENKLLFYYMNEDKLVLSNGNIIKNDINNVLGIPTLINKVDKKLLKKFIEKYSELEVNIIYEIDSIEYFPVYNEERKIIDEDSFKLIMNDGNTILTSSKNVYLLNKYNMIFASLGDRKGTINLNSGEVNNLIFIPYGE